MVPLALFGTWIGSYFVSLAPEQLPSRILGAMAILWGGNQLIQLKRKTGTFSFQLLTWHGYLVAFLGGIVSATTNAGGVVWSIYLLVMGLVKQRFVATLIAVIWLINLSKMVFYWNLSIMDLQMVYLGLAVVPVVFVGGYLGALTARFLSREQFLAAISVIMVISGAFLEL